MAKLKNVIAKEVALLRSRNVELSSLKTICLSVGPQRNLTTLTAALLFLHPRCQVLNHAGVRVLGDPRLDFLAEFSPQRLERFLRYGIFISRESFRSRRGGSITRSHAFMNHERMRRAFEESGLDLVRSDIETLFWKDSVRITRCLCDCGIDIPALVAREPRFRFLMPVRNPLDCAASNLRRNWGPGFWDPVPQTMEDSVRLVLDEVGWVRARARETPGHFLHFFEHELNAETLERIAAFLELECRDDWRERALSACRIDETPYDHPPALRAFYRAEVERRFADDPDFARGLLAFAGETAAEDEAPSRLEPLRENTG